MINVYKREVRREQLNQREIVGSDGSDFDDIDDPNYWDVGESAASSHSQASHSSSSTSSPSLILIIVIILVSTKEEAAYAWGKVVCGSECRVAGRLPNKESQRQATTFPHVIPATSYQAYNNTPQPDQEKV